jgi:hypothetical protein
MNRGPQNKGKQKPKGTKIKGITYYMGNTNKRATSKGIKRVITQYGATLYFESIFRKHKIYIFYIQRRIFMFIQLKIVAGEINIEIQKEQYCECFSGDLRNFCFVIVATYCTILCKLCLKTTT